MKLGGFRNNSSFGRAFCTVMCFIGFGIQTNGDCSKRCIDAQNKNKTKSKLNTAYNNEHWTMFTEKLFWKSAHARPHAQRNAQYDHLFHASHRHHMLIYSTMQSDFYVIATYFRSLSSTEWLWLVGWFVGWYSRCALFFLVFYFISIVLNYYLKTWRSGSFFTIETQFTINSFYFTHTKHRPCCHCYAAIIRGNHVQFFFFFFLSYSSLEIVFQFNMNETKLCHTCMLCIGVRNHLGTTFFLCVLHFISIFLLYFDNTTKFFHIQFFISYS